MIAVIHLGSRPVRHRQAACWVIAAGLVSSLAGCGQDPLASEVNLYHGLQGGEIAQQRPPPPGANDPYPNIGTIPARPPAPDIPTEQRIADQLAAERDAVHRLAAANPLVVLAPPPATQPPPKPAARDANANRVTVDAAAAPPSPSAPPPPQPTAAAAVDPLNQVPAVPATISSGPLPTFAAAAPLPPVGLGLVVPPSLPAAAAAVAPPAAAKPPANTVLVAFTPGSATLPPSANLNLRRFALAHKGVPLTVTGHGEAASTTPEAQAGALKLALQRAQAMAAALGDAGVPAVNLRLQADAVGIGGAATL